MNIRKITTICSLLLATQVAIAQQNMYVNGNDGSVNALPVSNVDYATFNVNNNWFTMSYGTSESTKYTITGTCTAAINSESDVKSVSTAPEVGICYSSQNQKPTIEDNTSVLGNEIKNYDFTLSSLDLGTDYYYRMYIKFNDEVIYGEVNSAKTQGKQPNNQTINGHLFIDLGLPSGTLWAQTNLGADTEADDGDFYAWGEVAAKEEYLQNNYMYYDATSSSYSKYNANDGLTTIQDSDDPAIKNWGLCQLPTTTQFDELKNSDNCEVTWTTLTNSAGKEIKGYKIVSKVTDESIFLPAAGRHLKFQYDRNSNGYYLTNSINSEDLTQVQTLYFQETTKGINSWPRYNGYSVRAVATPSQK